MREDTGNIIVAVVMSAYNGEKYLREQIDSILTQQGVAVKLFIRDDGSQDGTAAIIDEYAAAHPNVVFWNKADIKNIGITDSFLTLLRDVYDAEPDVPYFAFSDQDDVWLPDKLAAAVALMRERESDREKPTLYYSNKTFVDAGLKLISEEHIKYYGDFFDILWTSLASGCTFLMNRPLTRLSVCPLPHKFTSLHDAWVYRLAVLCGATIVFDERSHILYRQHGDNVCGQDGVSLIHKNWFSSIFSSRRHMAQKQLQEMIRLHDADISPDVREYVDQVMNYHQSFSAWWRLVTSPMARKRGAFLYCVWLVKLALRKI